MNFFKKIDDYILHFYPRIWVTRAHSFLPIGIGFLLLVVFGNFAAGWDPRGELPDADVITTLMIVPILIYVVYWFIFQSRYNVVKSGGRMSYGSEYLHYFFTLLVFSVAFLAILVIPISNNWKVISTIGEDELNADISALNKGYVFMDQEGGIEDLGNETYEVLEDGTRYLENYIYPTEQSSEQEIVTKREALLRIDAFKKAYNKYTFRPLEKDAERILANRLLLIDPDYQYSEEFYNENFGIISYVVSDKLSSLQYLHGYSPYYYYYNHNFFYSKDFWMGVFAVISWLALVVWIFKQMNLRHFVIGLICVCLTPLAVLLIGALLFGFSRGGEGMALFCLFLILLTYIVVGSFILKSYSENKLNQTAYVLTMFLQFWLPLFPAFIYGLVMVNRTMHYRYEQNDIFGFREEYVVYWISAFLGIVSIAMFKPIYAKFRSLPMNK